jgi:hypothetical protein
MRRIEDRLHPEEPWFTLRAQDILAPLAVQQYANFLRAAAAGLRHGDDVFTGRDVSRANALQEHAQDAEAVAAEMVLWQTQHPDHVKLPD